VPDFLFVLCRNSSASFPEVNTTFDLYFHDCGHGDRGNFKKRFHHQKRNNNVKKEKKNVKINGK